MNCHLCRQREARIFIPVEDGIRSYLNVCFVCEDKMEEAVIVPEFIKSIREFFCGLKKDQEKKEKVTTPNICLECDEEMSYIEGSHYCWRCCPYD